MAREEIDKRSRRRSEGPSFVVNHMEVASYTMSAKAERGQEVAEEV